MTSKFSGGCACGKLRYETDGEPLFQNHCQCLDCQRRSGTGHGSYLTFLRREVTRTGQGTLWEVVADSGNAKTSGFCSACGSPVFMTFAGAPEVFTVHAASLDDPTLFRPQAVTYASRAQAWDSLDRTLARFEEMPPR